MAGFQDAISQFNPYIQQLPVEAMTQVGMYKQQKYDEGVQKIQSYIDNVAGMDVVRDIDKAYLQSKLNELGSKLKTVAAGDFSNYQLVNSVGGMATQIAKDTNVQNAVSSASWYRKQLADMETAIKEGKSSQANVYDFNTKANSWLSSTKLGESFRDRYTPYTDVKKKAMEAIKALHPKLSQYDIPFVINSDGSLNKDKIADAMKRYKIEGISENQITQAIRASLTPDDMNQLGIDANYQFRGVTSEDLVNRAVGNYDKRRKAAVLKLEYLNEQKGMVSDPKLNDEIEDQIEYYERLLGKDGVPGELDEELESNISSAKNNPDSVKFSIYKDGFINEFGNAFSWTNRIEEYMKNPIKEQENWAMEMNHKRQVENRMRWKDEQDLILKKEEIRLKAEENALKKVELYGDPSSTPWTSLGTDTDNEDMSQEYFVDHVQSAKDNANATVSKLQKKYTTVQINEMLEDLKKNPNNPTKVKADALELVQELARQKNYLQGLEEKEKNLRADAKIKAENDPEYQTQVKKANLELNALDNKYKSASAVFNWRTGDALTISPSQLLSDINSGKATLRVDKAPLGYISLTYNVGGQQKKLEISKKAFGVDVAGAKELRPILLSVSEHITKYGDLNKKVKSLEDKEYKAALAPLITTLVPEIKALARDKNEKLPPVMFDRVSALITAADALGIAADEKYSTETSEKMLADENIKDTKIFVYRKGDQYEVHLKNPTVDKNVQKLRVNGSDINKYFGPGYVSDKSQESIRLNLGKGNTNLTGDPNRSTIQKAFGDFPGVTKYNITADLDEDLSNSNLYIPKINLMGNDGRWKTFEVSGPDGRRRVGYDQGISQLNSLTDDNLMKLLKAQYPKYDFSIFNR